MAIIAYQKGEKTKLSENFDVPEFVCHGIGCCTTVYIDEQLVNFLQMIRDHFGKPVKITSGYRCPKHNKSVNGATASRHAKGQAADIVVEGVAPAEVAKYAESIGIKGIGLYETAKDGFFVHIDTRTNKSFWYGQAQAYRSTFGGKSSNTTTEEKTPVSASSGLTAFIKKIQAACGAGVDGLAGPETLSKTVTISAKKNNRHKAVRAVQERLLELGYDEVGKPDGVAGPFFTSAVIHFQMDHGCIVDGVITKRGKTWRVLLGMKK